MKALGHSELPIVSVVIIVLNGANTIGACLDSLMSQTYPSDLFEIIVIDNGSVDGTEEVVKGFPVKLVQENKRGYASARNRGIQEAHGEIIAFIDADCVAESDWLEMLIEPYSDDEIGMVGGDIRPLFTGNVTTVEKFIDSAGFVGPPKNSVNGVYPYITTANVSYRKKVLEDAGAFNQNLSSCEDVDISRRVQIFLGKKALIVPDAIVFHRHRNKPSALINFMQRNGYGEIIIATLWKDYPPFQTDLKNQITQISKQFFALIIYAASSIYRLFRYLIGKRDIDYLLYPILYFMAESANIVGKVKALFDTRLLNHVPHQPKDL